MPGFPGRDYWLGTSSGLLATDEEHYEYFHPTTGDGHDSDFFSWTAVLVLDILLQATAKTDG
jgi:hypothetical protein